MQNQNPNTPQNHMRFNPKYNNGNGNGNGNGNKHYNQNQNRNFNNQPQLIQNIAPMQPIAPQHPFSMYLQEVTEFCQHLNSRSIELLPKHLTIKQAVEIVMIADKLQIPRLDALKTWQVCSKGVIISAEFLRCLFVRRNMLIGGVFYTDIKGGYRATISDGNLSYCGHSYKEQLIDNIACNTNSQEALKELALLDALSKAFPQLLMGIICATQVPPSKPSKLNFLGKLFTNDPLLTIFITAAFALGMWFQVTSNIYWVALLILTVMSCISAYKKEKAPITNDYLRIIKALFGYCAKTLHTFIGSCISTDSEPNNLKTSQQSVPKTTKLSSNEGEDMFLDLDEMEIKSNSKGYNTNPLN